MNIGIVLQARSQSKRFPRKIFTLFNNGKYSIQCILQGMKNTEIANKIILAMPKEDRKEIEQRIKNGELDNFIDNRFELFIADGAQDDLVDRYHKVMRKFGLDICARITGDCPMWIGAAKIMDEMLMYYMKGGSKGFLGNNLLVAKNPYPCGIDCEIFNYELMCWTKLHAKTNYELEHCVPLMYSDLSPFKIWSFENNRPNTMISNRIKDFSFDTKEDYELLKIMMDSFDKFNDLNKTIENLDIGQFNKTNMSKNFKK